MQGGPDSIRSIARPSKVLHVRGLPPHASEAEMMSLFSSLGTVSRILVLGDKSQAFVQMGSVAESTKALERFGAGPVVLRGSQVQVQYSNHAELRASSPSTSGTGGGSDSEGKDSFGQAPNSILLVTVLNTRIPVTLANLHQIFSAFGTVMKIVTFVQQGTLKALIQLHSVEAALAARQALEGRDIFQDCCHLRIGFSALKELVVKEDSAKQQDFTRLNLAATVAGPPGMALLGAVSPAANTSPYVFTPSGQALAVRSGAATINSPGIAGSPRRIPGTASAGLGFGGGVGVNGAGFGLREHGLMASSMSVPSSFPVSVSIPGVGLATGAVPPGAVLGADASGGPGCVLLVNNLPTDDAKCSPEILFTLFGNYGDVVRVKILFNKRDSALVQFANPQQAQLALTNLSRLPFHGRDLVITVSKMPQLQLPRSDDSEGARLTKDFSSSRRHRAGVRQAKNVFPPSRVLHLANLPESATEEQLRALFAEGSESKEPPLVQFFATDRRMALVALASVSEAVLALLRLHNKLLSDRYIRVSFSNKEPSTLKGVGLPSASLPAPAAGASSAAVGSSSAGVVGPAHAHVSPMPSPQQLPVHAAFGSNGLPSMLGPHAGAMGAIPGSAPEGLIHAHTPSPGAGIGASSGAMPSAATGSSTGLSVAGVALF